MGSLARVCLACAGLAALRTVFLGFLLCSLARAAGRRCKTTGRQCRRSSPGPYQSCTCPARAAPHHADAPMFPPLTACHTTRPRAHADRPSTHTHRIYSEYAKVQNMQNELVWGLTKLFRRDHTSLVSARPRTTNTRPWFNCMPHQTPMPTDLPLTPIEFTANMQICKICKNFRTLSGIGLFWDRTKQ